MFKAAVFDIDGTLITSDHRVTEETKRAIGQLKEAGVEVVIATGRAHYAARDVAQEAGIDNLIAMNGAGILHGGEWVYRKPLPTDTVQTLLEIAKAHRHGVFFCGQEGSYSAFEEGHMRDFGFHFERRGYPPVDATYHLHHEVLQLQLICNKAEEHYYDELRDAVRIFRWRVHDYGTDVVSVGIDKAHGIEIFLEKFDIAPEEAIAFGDGENDIDMLQRVGCGVAMGNAIEELKAVAGYTTRSNDEDGISFALQHFDLI